MAFNWRIAFCAEFSGFEVVNISVMRRLPVIFRLCFRAGNVLFFLFVRKGWMSFYVLVSLLIVLTFRSALRCLLTGYFFTLRAGPARKPLVIFLKRWYNNHRFLWHCHGTIVFVCHCCGCFSPKRVANCINKEVEVNLLFENRLESLYVSKGFTTSAFSVFSVMSLREGQTLLGYQCCIRQIGCHIALYGTAYIKRHLVLLRLRLPLRLPLTAYMVKFTSCAVTSSSSPSRLPYEDYIVKLAPHHWSLLSFLRTKDGSCHSMPLLMPI